MTFSPVAEHASPLNFQISWLLLAKQASNNFSWPSDDECATFSEYLAKDQTPDEEGKKQQQTFSVGSVSD